MPTGPISSLRLTFSRIAGSPNMQMWVAGHLSPPPTTTTTSTPTSSTTTSTTLPATATTTVTPTTVVPPTTAPPGPPAPPTPPSLPGTPASAHLPDTGAGPSTLPLVAAGLALLSLGLAVAHFAQRHRAGLASRFGSR